MGRRNRTGRCYLSPLETFENIMWCFFFLFILSAAEGIKRGEISNKDAQPQWEQKGYLLYTVGHGARGYLFPLSLNAFWAGREWQTLGSHSIIDRENAGTSLLM